MSSGGRPEVTHERIVCVRLDNVAKSVKSEPSGLHSLVSAGELGRYFQAEVGYGSKNRAFLFKVRCRGIERRALNGRRAHNLHEPRDGIHFNSLAAEALKGSAFVVVSETKTSPRSDVQPAKKLRRVGELVKCVEAKRLVIREIERVEFRPNSEGASVLTRHSSRHYSTRASQKNGVA